MSDAAASEEAGVGFPKILLAVPLVAAGMYLPAADKSLTPLPAGAVGMGHEAFETATKQISVGDRVVFENDSRFIHIIGPGKGGHLQPRGKNEPVSERLLMEQNATYTTGSWNTPGTYWMTCSVHPEMTVKIVVTR